MYAHKNHRFVGITANEGDYVGNLVVGVAAIRKYHDELLCSSDGGPKNC